RRGNVAISLRERVLGRFATLTNRFRVWYQLPFLLAMPTLVGQRVNMREHNLSDTERDPSLLKPQGGPSPRDQRAADGSYNDLGCPWMGMARARFGRCFRRRGSSTPPSSPRSTRSNGRQHC